MANDASYYGEGASVFAYKENRIRMVSEHIKIREDRTEKHPNGEWLADCTFVFENQEDTSVTIQMGFPDRGAFPDGEWTIQAFTTHIRGQSIPVTHKVVDPNHGREDALMLSQVHGKKLDPPLLPEDHDPDGWRRAAKEAMKEMNLRFGAAYTWPVTFAPKERIVVKNSYRFGGGNTMGPSSACVMDNTMPEKGAFGTTKARTPGLEAAHAQMPPTWSPRVARGTAPLERPSSSLNFPRMWPPITSFPFLRLPRSPTRPCDGISKTLNPPRKSDWFFP